MTEHADRADTPATQPVAETFTVPRIVAAAVKVRLKDPNGRPVELVVSALPPARHHTIMHPLTLAGLPIIGPDDQGSRAHKAGIEVIEIRGE